MPREAKYVMPNTGNKIAALRGVKGRDFTEYFDRQTPGFGIRVTSDGGKSYFLRKRRNGTSEIVRHTLDKAKFPPEKLTEARKEGRRLLELIANGGDPKVEEANRIAAAQRKRENSFRSVADDFIREKLA